MDQQQLQSAWRLLSPLFRAHPWHGVPIGAEAPAVLTVYVEIVPTDSVKYEVDKPTGYLMVDRPQKYSSYCPSLYGFIPQTYSAECVAEKAIQRTGRQEIVGDGDPLDVAADPAEHRHHVAVDLRIVRRLVCPAELPSRHCPDECERR
jgi:inorganic pyrophosphatase